MGGVAINLSKMGLTQEAKRFIKRAQHLTERIPLILFDIKSKNKRGVIRDLIEMGDLKEALKVAQKYDYVDTQTEIVKKLMEAEEEEIALGSIEGFGDPFWEIILVPLAVFCNQIYWSSRLSSRVAFSSMIWVL